ncbi:hypothetical protein CJ030_MR2G024055 [Morella rubra]|uniref:Uncharacterized protein n=1 Tax=Morella rubra TaxID=262757 RepID=A0A6A1WBD2_9ROSI|nr:hypothetical protein CJ030_MR2G024055 [Morella rubra]
MAAKKLLLRFFLFSCLIYSPTFFTRITAESPLREPDSLDSHSLKSELNHLKSWISILESTIEERNHELSSKDESIGQMERIIQEKSDIIASLQSEIEFFQTYMLMHWNEHGRPTFHSIIQKALEHKAEIKRWAEPHIETITTVTAYTLKCRIWHMMFNVVFDITVFSAGDVCSIDGSSRVRRATKSSIVLHVIKVQKMVDPCIQEAKKSTQPYFDQLNILAEHFLE